MCAGYAHAFACEDAHIRQRYIEEWQSAIQTFFAHVPDHFRSVAFKSFDVEQDPWIRQGITDPEDGINPFFTEDIENLVLDY